MLSPPKNKLFGGLSGRVFERSEFSPTPPHCLFFGNQAIRVAFSLVHFFWPRKRNERPAAALSLGINGVRVN